MEGWRVGVGNLRRPALSQLHLGACRSLMPARYQHPRTPGTLAPVAPVVAFRRAVATRFLENEISPRFLESSLQLEVLGLCALKESRPRRMTTRSAFLSREPLPRQPLSQRRPDTAVRQTPLPRLCSAYSACSARGGRGACSGRSSSQLGARRGRGQPSSSTQCRGLGSHEGAEAATLTLGPGDNLAARVHLVPTGLQRHRASRT